MASHNSLAVSYLLNLNRCSSGRANNRVVLALTSFLYFCISSAVIAIVIPFFFAEPSPATHFPVSSGGALSNALAFKVIVTLDKSKLTMRETLFKMFDQSSGKSSTVAKLLSSVNISSGKIYTNSGKSTLAVGINMTNSGNALEYFIPNKNVSQQKYVRGRYFIIQQHKIQENDL
ncbi:hypothetical protein Tco_1242779 [Tanacetum coccineum]